METPLTPLEFARRARKLYPRQEAVVDGSLRLTYAELFERCDRFSAALQRLGVAPGDRVAVISPNTHSMLEMFYAVPQIGAIVVPINYRLSAEDFKYIVGHSGARVVCAHSDHLDALDRIRKDLPQVEHFVALEGARAGWIDYETALAAESSGFRPARIAETDLISINYTSGTTSRPKGVMITHRNAWMNSVGTLAHFPMTVADRYLWTLPMFHANGWTFVWTVTAVGAVHLCLRKVDAPSIHNLVEHEGATVLCAAPTVLVAVANAPEAVGNAPDTERKRSARRVRVLTAGAPPAVSTIERVERDLGWSITQVYGLTETSPFITICEARPQHGELKLDELAAVKARQGVELITSGEIRVVDASGRDVPCNGETMGEIVARGNAVMHGYYQDPQATAAAIKEGWFHTGDAAVVHPDNYIEIRDRFKDVIISGGENISSIEVEGALMRHPAVLEAAVVGMRDEKWGEVPHAFVVLRTSEATSAIDLRAFCREHLAHFKVPKIFTFVTELPKTATGKVQKYSLRQAPIRRE